MVAAPLDRPARRNLAESTGEATIEFVLFFLPLTLFLLGLVLTIIKIEAATFAAETAARDATRVFMLDPDEGRPLAEHLVEKSFADHGFTVTAADVLQVRCLSACQHKETRRAVVTVSYDMPIPAIGWLLPEAARINVNASLALLPGQFKAER